MYSGAGRDPFSVLLGDRRSREPLARSAPNRSRLGDKHVVVCHSR